MATTQNHAKRHRSMNDPAALEGETNVDLDKFSFLWTVKNFSVVTRLDRCLKSPIFQGGPKFNHSWQIKLYPMEKVDQVDYMSVYLYLVDCGEVPQHHSMSDVVQTNFEFAILHGDGQPINIKGNITGPDKRILRYQLNTKQTFGFNTFITSADLHNPERKLLVNDTLKILCKIVVCGELKEKLIKANGGIYNPNGNPSLVKRRKMTKDKITSDIGKLFSDPIGYDVTLKTEKRNLKAHKVILMARSSVFAAMFNSNMLENQSNEVKIVDFDDEVVEGMLEHVYTGETKLMFERAEELLKIAEKYDMAGLKEDCEYQLTDNLNTENAAEILILAQSHNAPYLKRKTMEFIRLNKEELLKSQTFREVLTDAGLFADLFFFQ